MKREILKEDDDLQSPGIKVSGSHNKYLNNIYYPIHFLSRVKAKPGGFRNNIFGLTVLIVLYTIQVKKIHYLKIK